MSGARAEKWELREWLLAGRRARSPEEIDEARTAIRTHVLERLGEVSCVAAYEPLRTEPGSVALLRELHDRGARVLVPLTLPDHDLEWTRWYPDGAGAALGREAVGEADAVLVPALAVAADGTRLGRGGGSYDRALNRRRPDALVAALLFADEVLPAVPRDEWDVPVAWAVTPHGWVSLGDEERDE